MMNKETMFTTVIKYVAAAALTAGFGWNMWLTNQITAKTKTDSEQSQQLAADAVRFEYIAGALTRIEGILGAKQPLKEEVKNGR